MRQPACRSIAVAVGCAVLTLASPARAASQGSLGGVSRGSITISVSLRTPARATGLADFALTGSATAAAQELCFRGAAHGYTLAASGSGPDGALTLSNGTERIAYRVEWLPRDAGDPVAPLVGQAPVAIRAVADPADCGRAPGAGRLRIALDEGAAARVESGAPYTGTLVLTLAPD